MSPYLAYKAWELRFVLARVPAPLEVLWIDYRLEQSWGIGMPGDNETGFVVYRLTERSRDRAWSEGTRLREVLAHPRQSWPSEGWRPTPIDLADPNTSDRWRRFDSDGKVVRQRLSFENYLGRYGFDIPLAQGITDEADAAIRMPGSFYLYGPGGSITVVDPHRGKVYFAYAG